LPTVGGKGRSQGSPKGLAKLITTTDEEEGYILGEKGTKLYQGGKWRNSSL